MMKKNPLVSVRLMVYNNEDFIRDTIEGILMQKTTFPVEVVVGDDFSTDNTLTIIKSYKNTEKISIRILDRPVGGEYWQKRNHKNASVRTNFMDILENCKGDYIALLDGDDYWTDPFKLQKQVDFLEGNNDYFFVSSNSKLFKNNKIIQTAIEGDVNIYDFIIGNKLGRQTAAFLFRSNNLNEFLDYLKRYAWPFGDLALIFWCLKNGKGRVFKDTMAYYRVHDLGLWSSAKEEDRIKNFIVFYALVFKSEINPTYDLKLFNKSLDWTLHRIREIKKPVRKTKNMNLAFSKLADRGKEILKKIKK